MKLQTIRILGAAIVVAFLITAAQCHAGEAIQVSQPTIEQRLETMEDVVKNHNEVVREHRRVIIALIQELERLKKQLESFSTL